MYSKKCKGFLLWDACISLLIVTIASALLFGNTYHLQKQKNYLSREVDNYQELVNLSKKAVLTHQERTVKEVDYHGICVKVED